MKTYLIFMNEPHARIYEYLAKNKYDALKAYNSEHQTDYKIKKSGPLEIIEKTAWSNYNFKKASFAS